MDKSEVIVERGLLKKKNLFDINGQFLVVANRKILKLFGQSVFEKLKEKKGYSGVFRIPNSEKAKSLIYAKKLYEKIISAGLDRSSTLVALGGGVTSDLTGFAASTFSRGISWIGIPTTLCAQVDASIGGKTGINLPEGKNLVGTFWNPKLVLIDADALSTLPEKEWKNGFGEVIKYGLISEPWIFENLEKHGLGILAEDKSDILDQVIERCIRAKIKVVQEDFSDKGIRNHLNLGHTLAHALEGESGFRGFSHGVAVAMGILFATNISVQLGSCHSEVYDRVRKLIVKMGLFKSINSFDKKALIDKMRRDKKRIENNIRFVLPVDIGKVILKDLPVKSFKNDSFWRI